MLHGAAERPVSSRILWHRPGNTAFAAVDTGSFQTATDSGVGCGVVLHVGKEALAYREQRRCQEAGWRCRVGRVVRRGDCQFLVGVAPIWTLCHHLRSSGRTGNGLEPNTYNNSCSSENIDSFDFAHLDALSATAAHDRQLHCDAVPAVYQRGRNRASTPIGKIHGSAAGQHLIRPKTGSRSHFSTASGSRFGGVWLQGHRKRLKGLPSAISPAPSAPCHLLRVLAGADELAGLSSFKMC